MKNFKTIKLYALAAFISFGLVSCSSDDETGTVQLDTIAGIASDNANLSILVQALVKADLVGVLDSPGNYTVFAPTNAAFTNFLSANGFANLDAVPVPLLTEVLLNHVVSGTLQSSQLNTGYIKTLGKGSASSSNTLSMYVAASSTGVRLNNQSNVVLTSANILASNGIIHVVDAVIGLPTVVTFATADPNFSSLVGALTSPGQPDFVTILSGNGPFTVFAPTNEAFTALNAELAAIPLTPTAEQLTAVLQYHVVSGNVLSTTLTNNQVVPTLEGGSFTIGLTGGATITDANSRVSNIVAVDVQAANGVIHVLDKVLLPTL
ncbi:fasciclin domain-containing protein [Flavobacterium orientale]|uniref:Beta-Ig-H3/fasciclin domain-containing protein n=1 Tax=Flavobacterium orientale TaxID=1756020 RepID=A0A917DCT3_9FLAO|nr:fasciclin domain-containing protein [Flavobacterium orientale]GGD25885.1 beta-Ig-H3/fasciclin domain-containing protein [Flavobacterium orientale]